MSRPALNARAILCGRPFIATLLLAFTWLLLMRGILIVHSRVWPELGWILLTDATGAVVLALLLTMTHTGWMRILLVLLLGTAFYIAGQHLWAHGTIYRLAHLGRTVDPVFLQSSVLTWWLLLLPVCWLMAYALHRLHRRIDPGPWKRVHARLAAAIACVAAYGTAVTSLTLPDNNVVVSTLAQIPDAAMSWRAPPQPSQVAPLERDIESRFFHREVNGRRVDNRPNVLIVVIEGMSGAYLPSVTRYHDLAPAVLLHGLEQNLDRRGFRIYRNVLSMQRQTDRGSYPMLCGAYPRVGTMKPKLVDIAEKQVDPSCVPDVLARHGYRTGYLQAAPLSYMQKDAFMPRIGFQEVRDASHFGLSENAQGWGVPDERFFPAAAEWLMDLDADDGPWFAVTLNVGTHHPFADGADARERSESGAGSDAPGATRDPASTPQPDRQAAFSLMAKQLVDFLDALAEARLLDETLVVITSDEAGGFYRGNGKAQARMLDGNFGALAVRPPQGLPLEDFAPRNNLVATLDIALTTLDAAGLADRDPVARNMIGRSLLVSRAAVSRGLLVGDTYAGHTVFLLESGELLACSEGLIRCDSWTFTPQRTFGSLTQDSTAPFLDLATRQRLVNRAAIIDTHLEARD